VVIQAASFIDLRDLAELRSEHGPGRRAVHRERTVTTPAVVVLEVIAEESSQVSLVEHDDVVEAITPDAADRPLDEWVLPWTPRCSDDFFDFYELDALPEGRPVRAVAISDQVARRRRERPRRSAGRSTAPLGAPSR